MPPAAAKSTRVGFSTCSVSLGVVIHGASLLAAHLVAKRWKEPIAKLGTYAAFTAGARFACKLVHERITRREKQFLSRVEEAEQMAL